MTALVAQAGRFGVVGLATTALHLCAAYLASSIGGFAPGSANTVGFACAVTFAYLGHFSWTFSRRAEHSEALGRFAVASLFGFATSSLIVFVVTHMLQWSMLAALVLVGIAVPCLNFVAFKFWVFRSPRDLDGRSMFAACVAWGFAAAVLFALYFWGRPFNHDTSWYLVATEKFLNGARLYVDVIEINPPLAFYVTAPPIIVSELFGGGSTSAFLLYVTTLLFISLAWSGRIVAASEGLVHAERIVLFGGVILSLILLPIPFVGQREHLMLVFSLPYFLALCLDPSGSNRKPMESFALGAFAFFGLAMKPYFLFAPLLVSAVAALQNKTLRVIISIENITIALLCGLYFLFIVVFHKEYIDHIVPMATEVYHAYGYEFFLVFTKPHFLVFPVVLYLIILQTGRLRDSYALRLFAVATGFCAAYLVQFKGWPSHAYPMNVFLLLTLCAMIARGFGRKISALAAVLAAAVMLLPPVLEGPYKSRLLRPFLAAYPVPGVAPSVLVLSSNLWASFPFVNLTGATWASRFPAQWLVPGAVGLLAEPHCRADPQSCSKVKQILNYSRQATVDDLIAFKPGHVFVDERKRKSYFVGEKFNYLDYLSDDPRFASLWKSYRKVAFVQGYALWVRVDDPGALGALPNRPHPVAVQPERRQSGFQE
ncbi:GtrA family protein [Sphingosinicella soli]|uniref:Putative flippase GtrA n=1 Tax=Sphingosinicella soli TaxID=333708 RepID=A0A7W7B6H7_9SPHN|nr:GtrA family protein [Sphingosinicella soli]MBB4633782.1 putative flippase GtrA [Sphingosinicella soli]